MDLPLEYRWLQAHEFKGFTPWFTINPRDSEGIRKEYQLETQKDILPFARRQDNDDIAGFEILNGEIQSKIITAHLTWAGKFERDGFPIIVESEDVFSWLSEVVIPATKEWMSEEDLADLKSENK